MDRSSPAVPASDGEGCEEQPGDDGSTWGSTPRPSCGVRPDPADRGEALGAPMIGGLIVGTFLTLYVVPAMYSYIASREASSVLDVNDHMTWVEPEEVVADIKAA